MLVDCCPLGDVMRWTASSTVPSLPTWMLSVRWAALEILLLWLPWKPALPARFVLCCSLSGQVSSASSVYSPHWKGGSPLHFAVQALRVAYEEATAVIQNIVHEKIKEAEIYTRDAY